MIIAGLVLAFVLLVLVWQAPNLIAMVPSRYVAAYAPEPVQQLTAGSQIEVLPTAVASVDVSALLPPTAIPTITPSPTVPLTFTPIPVLDEPNASPTPVPTSTPTPLPPTPTPTTVPIPAAARLENIKHHFQTWNNCGPATLAMSLSYFDWQTDQEETAAFLKPDPEDRNVTPDEMAAFVNENTELKALSQPNGDLEQLRQFVGNGMPVIVETGIDPPGDFSWMGWYGHYLLVVGYEDESETIWVFDSWLGTEDEIPAANVNEEGAEAIEFGPQNGRGRTISYGEFDRYWRHFNSNYIVLYTPEQEALVEEIIGDQLDEATMWAAALERTMAELDEEPENPFLWFNLGTIYNAQAEYEFAATAFDKAREIGLPWRMLWYQFGPYEAYYQIGRYQDVIELTNITLDRRPYFEESFYYRGLASIAVGEDSAGQRDLERAANFNPNFSPAAEALTAVTED